MAASATTCFGIARTPISCFLFDYFFFNSSFYLIFFLSLNCDQICQVQVIILVLPVVEVSQYLMVSQWWANGNWTLQVSNAVGTLLDLEYFSSVKLLLWFLRSVWGAVKSCGFLAVSLLNSFHFPLSHYFGQKVTFNSVLLCVNFKAVFFLYRLFVLAIFLTVLKITLMPYIFFFYNRSGIFSETEISPN